MNYRHTYHAGNFADVVKHAVLALVIERLKLKDAAFRVIDTHAGVGLYDLAGEAALKTAEWHGGIGKIMGPEAEPLPAPVAEILAPYLAAVHQFNTDGRLRYYPGSPKIARALMRPQDRMVVNELHPQDGKLLESAFAGDRQVKVTSLDGWTALKALLPPKERRGVVLIDPPFEEPGEHGRLVSGLVEAVKRFATGVYLLWYPIKDRRLTDRLERDLAASGLPRLLVAELWIRSGHDANLLNGSGLAILNPPFQIEQQLSVLGSFLADRLAEENGARWRMEWVRREN